MAQFLRPASDVSDGAWLPSAGGDLYATIDESSASDSDYDYTESESAFEVALSTGTDPSSSTGHTVRYRAAGNGVLDLVVTLKQGTTTIASWTEEAASASFTNYAHTLAGGEADAITDYADLRLHFEAAAGGGGGPVAFDAATDVIELTGDGVVSLTHTCAGANRAVFAGVHWHHAGGGSGAGTLTYGGSAMTQIWNVPADASLQQQNAGFQLTGQSTGAQTVTSDVETVEPLRHFLGVISMTGVHQTLPVGTEASASGTESPIAVTVGSVGADDLVIDNVFLFGDLFLTIGENQTLANEEDTAVEIDFRQSYQDGADGGVMSWTFSGTPDAWQTTAIAFKPAS